MSKQEKITHDLPSGIDELLARAREGVSRLTPQQSLAARQQGAVIVDTRTEFQRKSQGELPGALVVDRTVLEWRLDPSSADRIPEAVDYAVEFIIVCRQGYSSSLAVASLRSIGLARTTDMIGGMEGWISAGLPLGTEPADVRL